MFFKSFFSFGGDRKGSVGFTADKLFVASDIPQFLLIPLAMIRGLISERSETASEATTEVQNKWSSSQLVTGPFISIPCYENYEETYYENGATKIRVKKVKNYIHILPELLDIKDGIISPKIHTNFKTLFDTFSTTNIIPKQSSRVNIIFSPWNPIIPSSVKARQNGISDIKANISNLLAYFFFEWVYW